jgi:5,10-methylenetetrahydromethanopterin reductase
MPASDQKREVEQMLKLGIEIIPVMPVSEVIEIAQAAESLGYSYCLLADEGFMPDVYVSLGAIAKRTSRIMIGPVTNGYTRHPAVTAVAAATLNELSNGRALVTLVAGGSFVLDPMKIPREKPLVVIRDSIEIMRRLWTGESITWQGNRFELNSAQLTFSTRDIPIWIAGRGKHMLKLGGELADGVMLMVKTDLKEALEIVGEGSALTDRRPQRIYLDRISYTPQLISQTADFFPYVIADTPARQLKGVLSDHEVSIIQEAIAEGGPAAAAKLITLDMIKKFKIAGTMEDCSRELSHLVDEHRLDAFILNLTSGGLEENIRLMTDVRSIAEAAAILED